MALSSSSLPRPVAQLRSIADRHLGEGTTAQFAASLIATGYADELNKPMLQGGGRWARAALGIGNAARVSAVRVENSSEVPLPVTLSTEFPEASVEEVFSRFVRSTAHSNARGDFRRWPERFAPILLGPRYFVFHGDGNCILLANLLAALLRRLAGAEVNVFYTVAKERAFMHAFVERRDGDRREILDADQKTITGWRSPGPPYGMIYQILSLAGVLAYEALPGDQKCWLFDAATRAEFAQFHGDGKLPPPRIYRPSPTPQLIAELFAEAKEYHVETVSLDADDYAWKSTFRREMRGREVLACMDSALTLLIPPGGTVAFGLDAASLPAIVGVLPLIFFGRVPATISAEVPASGRLALQLPELPWMLTFPGFPTEVSINGRRCRTHSVDGCSVIGAGDLEGLIGDGDATGDVSCVVETRPGSKVCAVLPFNALSFNSGTTRIDTNADLTCALVEGI